MKNNYVLIDFENVAPENLDLLDQDWIRVYVFVGKNQTKLPFSVVKAIQKMGDRAQYVEMSGTGHNALDFHIAYYVGRLSANDKDAYFHIISNDQGFDPLIAHLKQECKTLSTSTPCFPKNHLGTEAYEEHPFTLSRLRTRCACHSREHSRLLAIHQQPI